MPKLRHVLYFVAFSATACRTAPLCDNLPLTLWLSRAALGWKETERMRALLLVKKGLRHCRRRLAASPIGRRTCRLTSQGHIHQLLFREHHIIWRDYSIRFGMCQMFYFYRMCRQSEWVLAHVII